MQKFKMGKSWAVTLVAFIVAISAPILDGPLANYGIDISEKDLEHFLYLMLGIGATGAAAGGAKKVVEAKKTGEKQTQILENIGTLVKQEIEKEKKGATDPGVKPKKPKEAGMQDHGWYSTNLEYKEHTGAIIYKKDACLIIRAPEASVISGTVKKGDNIIQANQGTDTITFNLLKKENGNLVPIMGELEFNFKAWIDERWQGADGRFTVI